MRIDAVELRNGQIISASDDGVLELEELGNGIVVAVRTNARGDICTTRYRDWSSTRAGQLIPAKKAR